MKKLLAIVSLSLLLMTACSSDSTGPDENVPPPPPPEPTAEQLCYERGGTWVPPHAKVYVNINGTDWLFDGGNYGICI